MSQSVIDSVLAQADEMPGVKGTRDASRGLPRLDGHEAGLGESVQHPNCGDERVGAAGTLVGAGGEHGGSTLTELIDGQRVPKGAAVRGLTCKQCGCGVHVGVL